MRHHARGNGAAAGAADARSAPVIIVGVDPGTAKCGVAALNRHGRILGRDIVSVADVSSWVESVVGDQPHVVVVGDGTGRGAIRADLGARGLNVEQVDEYGTSREARQRYLADHPERGWRRLIPIGLRFPDAPYDDYVAVILAERRLEAENRLTNEPAVC